QLVLLSHLLLFGDLRYLPLIYGIFFIGYFILWGLIFFVIIPLPVIGVYAGSIAGYIFKVETKTAFKANAIGIIISSLIVWGITLFFPALHNLFL
ncbi:MAG: small multi-drug export protein, partial [Patiriisocius sp.]